MVKIIVVVTETVDQFNKYISILLKGMVTGKNIASSKYGAVKYNNTHYIWYGDGVDIRKFTAMNIFDIIFVGDMSWLQNKGEDIKILEYRKMRGNMYGKD